MLLVPLISITVGILAHKTGTSLEVILMQSTVLILRFGNNLGKQETALNERIAEKEKEGWEVVDMQNPPPAFGSQPAIILRLARESN